MPKLESRVLQVLAVATGGWIEPQAARDWLIRPDTLTWTVDTGTELPEIAGHRTPLDWHAATTNTTKSPAILRTIHPARPRTPAGQYGLCDCSLGIWPVDCERRYGRQTPGYERQDRLLVAHRTPEPEPRAHSHDPRIV